MVIGNNTEFHWEDFCPLRHVIEISTMSKIFCDPVHGQILLDPVCVAIIDTPEFQRLRNIKQTGFLDYVYPGATHTRFVHSLGVCHLAGLFICHLHERQPELQISAKEILCVKIAGLCHDLGHGPLSHTWEIFMKEGNHQRNDSRQWTHEQVSLNIFEYLIRQNNLLSELKKHGIDATEINIIKHMIIGTKPKNPEKTFLYQIVNNDDSGLDVDKWDYFLRDCHFLGLPCSFEYQRLIQFAKVLPVNGENIICFRDKLVDCVYDAFRTRSNLHKFAYQHRVNRVLETMYIDAILKADDVITSPSGDTLHLWNWSMAACFSEGEELAFAIEKFCTLTDDLIFCSLKHCKNPKLKDVVALITAIEKRSHKCCGIYQQVALKIIPKPLNKYAVLKAMENFLPDANKEVLNSNIKLPNGSLTSTIKDNSDVVVITNSQSGHIALTIKDIEVAIISVNWGKKEKNPVQFVNFYTKGQPSQICPVNLSESSITLPRSFEELQLHVYCRRFDKFALNVSKLCFEKYCQQFLKTSI